MNTTNLVRDKHTFLMKSSVHMNHLLSDPASASLPGLDSISTALPRDE
jgi:hypothetical protein